MFLNIFKIKPKKFLGIDIGTFFLRIVELRRQGQAYKLENYGEAETSFFEQEPFRVFKKNALLLSNRNIAKAIQAICEEAGIETKEVNFSIPDFSSFFISFELPAMGKDEVPEAIRYEVRPYVPLPLEEITLDWSITEGEFSKTPLKVLVAAIPNEVVNQYQEIAELANLKLKILEPEAFALARSLSKDEKEKKLIGLVDIGAQSTNCSILEERVLKTSYSFNIAGNELTEVIARSLNIDYNKAEELKKRQGLLIGKGKENIREILLPLVDSILEEIKKVFRNFYQREGKQVEKIVLAGGLVSMPGLQEYFTSELKKEVSLADPFLDISYPPILQETLKEIGPAYAIAVGLALKGLE